MVIRFVEVRIKIKALCNIFSLKLINLDIFSFLLKLNSGIFMLVNYIIVQMNFTLYCMSLVNLLHLDTSK